MLEDELMLKLAQLSRLDLEPNELRALTADMTHIIALMDTIQEVSSQPARPAQQTGIRLNQLRQDHVLPSLESDKLLANASVVQGDYFVVPNMIQL